MSRLEDLPVILTARDLAKQNLILHGVVGSTALGTKIDTVCDRDEMGVCVEPPEYVLGLNHFEQSVYRTQPEGVPSGPGDLDETIYSLRKFCRLAARGNPSMLVLLFLPEYLHLGELGTALVARRELFYSREAGFRFLGYLTSQMMKLTGEKTKKVSRPELVAQFGYDTKFAMHALRLGYQGLEYLETRKLILPTPRADFLREVRSGRFVFDEVLAEIKRVRTELEALAESIRAEADWGAINEFLVEAHRRHWGFS